MSDRSARGGASDAGGKEPTSTRDRILDVALDLFTEQGYEKTSLREIAERLGFTKAALYYHFASKDEIFMALHERLHALAGGSLSDLSGTPMTIESWAALLDSFIEMIPANRRLILMHERNRATFSKLHNTAHARQHRDLEETLRDALSNPAVSLRDRIRMGCAFATVMGGVLFSGEGFEDVQPEQLVSELKSAMHDLLGVSRRGGARRGRS